MTTDSAPPSSCPHWFHLTPDTSTELDILKGQPKFRIKQIFEWIYRKQVPDFEGMTNLSKSLRADMANQTLLYSSSLVDQRFASDGVQKLLLAWPDGATSECVLIPDEERNTACISTQVGCPVGCVFCASGLNGLQRNLTAGEIVEQAMRVETSIPDGGLTNIVLMGIGEPMVNYTAVLQAVRTINADWGMNIGARKITISTVGVPDRIRQLAREGLQVTLALSLHAPNDELRQMIVPWAKQYSIESIIQACREYFDLTGREITLEYVLLGSTNDQPRHARELATLARTLRSNVNLIRFNPVEGLPWKRPASEDANHFMNILRDKGINTHMRKSRGLDIDAACGQLRRRHETEKQ